MTGTACSQAYTTLTLRVGTLRPSGLHQSEETKECTAHSCERNGEGCQKSEVRNAVSLHEVLSTQDVRSVVGIHGISAAAQFSEASSKQSPARPGSGSPVKTAFTNLHTHTHSAPIAQDRNILPKLGNKAREQSETRSQQGARTETGNNVSLPPWQYNTFSASRAKETGLRKTCSNVTRVAAWLSPITGAWQDGAGRGRKQ